MGPVLLTSPNPNLKKLLRSASPVWTVCRTLMKCKPKSLTSSSQSSGHKSPVCVKPSSRASCIFRSKFVSVHASVSLHSAITPTIGCFGVMVSTQKGFYVLNNYWAQSNRRWLWTQPMIHTGVCSGTRTVTSISSCWAQGLSWKPLKRRRVASLKFFSISKCVDFHSAHLALWSHEREEGVRAAGGRALTHLPVPQSTCESNPLLQWESFIPAGQTDRGRQAAYFSLAQRLYSVQQGDI